MSNIKPDFNSKMAEFHQFIADEEDMKSKEVLSKVNDFVEEIKLSDLNQEQVDQVKIILNTVLKKTENKEGNLLSRIFNRIFSGHRLKSRGIVEKKLDVLANIDKQFSGNLAQKLSNLDAESVNFLLGASKSLREFRKSPQKSAKQPEQKLTLQGRAEIAPDVVKKRVGDDSETPPVKIREEIQAHLASEVLANHNTSEMRETLNGIINKGGDIEDLNKEVAALMIEYKVPIPLAKSKEYYEMLKTATGEIKNEYTGDELQLVNQRLANLEILSKTAL